MNDMVHKNDPKEVAARAEIQRKATELRRPKFWRDFGPGLILVLIIAVLGILAQKAVAAPFTPELETAYVQAEEYWGAEPTQCTTITKEVVALTVGGEATQPKPGWTGECVIKINEADRPCEIPHIMEHEVGHLEGHDHSEGGVMAPEYDYRADCEAEELPQIEKERKYWHDKVLKEEREINQQVKKIRANERRWRKHAVVHNDGITNPVQSIRSR